MSIDSAMACAAGNAKYEKFLVLSDAASFALCNASMRHAIGKTTLRAEGMDWEHAKKWDASGQKGEWGAGEVSSIYWIGEIRLNDWSKWELGTKPTDAGAMPPYRSSKKVVIV